MPKEPENHDDLEDALVWYFGTVDRAVVDPTPDPYYPGKVKKVAHRNPTETSCHFLLRAFREYKQYESQQTTRNS